MTDKQYDGIILENLEDLEDITAIANLLPESEEKQSLIGLLEKKTKKNQRKLETPVQPQAFYIILEGSDINITCIRRKKKS